MEKKMSAEGEENFVEVSALKSGTNKDDCAAWLVAFSSLGINALTYGIVWSSAVFYLMFLDAFAQSQKLTALIGSLMTASLYAIGPLTGYLSKRIGYRKLICMGGLLSGSGLVLSSFVNNIYVLFLTYSVMSGIGYGMASIPSIFAVAQRFDKKRTLAFGVSASGVAVGTILFPAILIYLMEKYTWRGVLLVCGGISFNICVLSLTISLDEKSYCACTLKSSTEESKQSTSDRARLARIFRLPRFVTLIINNLLYCLALIIVHIHISAFVKRTFTTTSSISGMYVSIIGVSNLAGRSILGLICHISPVITSSKLYAVTHFLSLVAIFLLPMMHDLIYVAFCCALYGFCSASIGTLMPDILANMVLEEDFGYAYGFTLVFEAIGTLAGGPISGWMLDTFEDYTYLFIMSAAVVLLGVIVFVFPEWCQKSSTNNKCISTGPMSNVKCFVHKVPPSSKHSIASL